MWHQDDIPGQSNSQRLSRQKTAQPRRWVLPFVTVAALVLTSLTCALNDKTSLPAADHIVILTRWPTLTRTPLPTLTPTAASPTPIIVVMSAESEEISTPPSPAMSNPTVSEETAIPAEGLILSTEPTMIVPMAADVIAPDPSELSPTPLKTEATEPVPPISSPTATEAPTPTSTPTLLATATPVPAGWQFSGLRLSPDPYDSGLLLHGDVINNTGAVQRLLAISGTFFDAQGQIVADGNTAAYWPIASVPQGGRLPFELVVLGLEGAADFDLTVEAEPSVENLRQDFEFIEVNLLGGAGDYCLTGKLQNPGGNLASFLIVVAILYDGQDQVINFSDDYSRLSEGLTSGQTVGFEVCVDPLNQDVARYELQAWGL